MGKTNENNQPSENDPKPVTPIPTEPLPKPDKPTPPPDRFEKGNKDLPESIEHR